MKMKYGERFLLGRRGGRRVRRLKLFGLIFAVYLLYRTTFGRNRTAGTGAIATNANGMSESEAEANSISEMQELAWSVSTSDLDSDYDTTPRSLYTMGPPDFSSLRAETGNRTLWFLPEKELRCRWQYNYVCKFWFALRCHLFAGFRQVRVGTVEHALKHARGGDVILIAHRAKSHASPAALYQALEWRGSASATDAAGVRIGVLHVANEIERSNWPWYTDADFVLRNYWLPHGRFPPHVGYVPLHHQMPSVCTPESPLRRAGAGRMCTCGGQHLPRASERRYLYSFSGSLRRGRGQLLKLLKHTPVLASRGEIRVARKFGGDVREDGQDPKVEHIRSILDSVFVLCPCGNAMETHRIYEALALAAVPVIQRCEDEKAGPEVDGFFPLRQLVHESHEDMVAFVARYADKPSDIDQLQRETLQWWTQYTYDVAVNATRIATSIVPQESKWNP